MSNGVLRLPLPEKLKVVGFTDDVAMVVVARHMYEFSIADSSEPVVTS